jgi:hypothetical protein
MKKKGSWKTVNFAVFQGAKREVRREKMSTKKRPMHYRRRLLGEAWLVLARYQCRKPGKSKTQARHNLMRRLKQVLAIDRGDFMKWIDVDLFLRDEDMAPFMLGLDKGAGAIIV